MNGLFWSTFGVGRRPSWGVVPGGVGRGRLRGPPPVVAPTGSGGSGLFGGVELGVGVWVFGAGCAGGLRAVPRYDDEVPPDPDLVGAVHGAFVGIDPGAVFARSPFTQ